MTDDDLIPEEFHDRHPGTKANLRPFAYGHLPKHLQLFSRPAADLAYEMVAQLPDDPELGAGLRHLRQAKDCFVTAAVFNPIAVDAMRETLAVLADEETMAAVAEAEEDVAAGRVTPVHPFKVGDRLRMNLLPEDVGRQMAVTVTDVGVCEEDDGGDLCGEPTVHFADPQTGQPDEAHASDFTLVEGA